MMGAGHLLMFIWFSVDLDRAIQGLDCVDRYISCAAIYKEFGKLP